MSGRTITNWQDKREIKYSATSYQHVFELLINDPKKILAKIYATNSMAKWQGRKEEYDDYVGDLVAHLHERYHQDQQSLVEAFNTWGNYFIVRYTRNKMNSKQGHNHYYGAKHDLIDDHDPDFIQLPSSDKAYELEQHELRNIRMSDPDVLLWMLGTTRFSAMTSTHKDLYTDWFNSTRESLKRVPIAEIARKKNFPEREAVKVIGKINKILRQRVKAANDLRL